MDAAPLSNNSVRNGMDNAGELFQIMVNITTGSVGLIHF